MSRIFVCLFALLLSSALPVVAQSKRGAKVPQQATDTTKTAVGTVKGVQYASPQEAAAALLAQKRLPLLAGVSVSADLCGAVMATCTPYGQYEAAARLNLRGRFFPVFEMGVGVSNHTSETTDLHYKVHAPYYRVGLDYNVAKNARALGRIMVGVRYGFTSYKFDVDGPDCTDGVYGTLVPFSYKGVRGTNHWGEAVFGLESKVWGIVHVGWTFRYRVRFYRKDTQVGNAWYVPGYGKEDTHALGGTFNVIFDI